MMTFDSTLPMTNAKLLSFSFDFSIILSTKTTVHVKRRPNRLSIGTMRGTKFEWWFSTIKLREFFLGIWEIILTEKFLMVKLIARIDLISIKKEKILWNFGLNQVIPSQRMSILCRGAVNGVRRFNYTTTSSQCSSCQTMLHSFHVNYVQMKNSCLNMKQRSLTEI